MHPGLTYLETLPPWDGRGGFTLDTIKRILTALDNPQDKVRAIHVAGTNGKGTVCALLAAMLHAAGNKVGQFASPHLSHVTERVIIAGAPVQEELLGSAVLRVRDILEQEALTASYFEVTTAAAFLLFSEVPGLDWMVIEVGLGGRLDATNAIARPAASVITGISLEHTQILGETLAAIAKEKAGILKCDVPGFIGRMPGEALGAIESHGQSLGCALERFDKDFRFDSQFGLLEFGDDEQYHFPAEWIGARAEYQLLNAALAARVALALGLSPNEVTKGLRLAKWPGRMELFTRKGMSDTQDVSVLLDVAHNPEGIEALLNHLRHYLRGGPEVINHLTVVISILDRKDWRSMLDIFAEFADELLAENRAQLRWIFTDSQHGNVVPPQLLRDYLKRGEVVEDPDEALEKALRYASQESSSLVLITGSIFLVGRLRPAIADEPFRTIKL